VHADVEPVNVDPYLAALSGFVAERSDEKSAYQHAKEAQKAKEADPAYNQQLKYVRLFLHRHITVYINVYLPLHCRRERLFKAIREKHGLADDQPTRKRVAEFEAQFPLPYDAHVRLLGKNHPEVQAEARESGLIEAEPIGPDGRPLAPEAVYQAASEQVKVCLPGTRIYS
jgi:hypothetical protein